ncbi:sporulation protein [Aquibacillus kalidii]|uniref:sporulation protein n=1 Tax=Aquibacillus kalidii TaxID=2762597 RepID=UPI001648F054|nr:sporulation protein [Aquibacillus kalidii]
MVSKLLSFIKFAAPKVDLVLNTSELKAGEQLSGKFFLKGGWVLQKAKRLECDFIRVCPGKKPEVIEPVKTLLMSRSIEANEKTEICFTYQLPKELPPTCAHVSYRLQTKLVLADDSKHTDHDEVIVTA